MKTLFTYTVLLLLLFAGRAYPQAGLTLVKDINPGAAHAFNAIATNTFFWKSGNNAIFPVADGVTGTEFWISDGTTAGTSLLKDLNPGTGSVASVAEIKMAYFGNTLIFPATGNFLGTGNNFHLLKTDGTSGGTAAYLNLKGLIPGTTGPGVAEIFSVGNTVLFTLTASGGVSELWKTDGTAAGSQLVKDINPGSSDGIQSGIVVNNMLFFSATDATHGAELWRSDGTDAGTILLKDILSGTGAGYYGGVKAVLGNTLFFSATDATITGLWKSDGTPAGTVMVKDVSPGNLTAANNQLFFSATTAANGTELWRSDGTTAGTFMVKDINPGSASASPGQLTNVNGTVYFIADDGVNGAELWKSDGTDAGTVMVKDINPTSSSNILSLLAVNNQLFFTANDGTTGVELWTSDGTAAGTYILKDLAPGVDNSSLSTFLAYNNWLFFIRSAPTTSIKELWKTDGTTSGTVPVYTDATVNKYAFINNIIFANVTSPVYGREPFAGDPNAKLDQTITFDPLPQKTYGDAVFTLSATTSSGLPLTFSSSDETIARIVNGNTVQILHAGSVTITAKQSGSSAWNLADTSQILTIGKAPLTITAVNKAKLQYEPMPSFEVTYTGFVNGDDAQDLTTPVTITTVADENTAPGEYDIVPAGATSDNYNITFVNGTLLVTAEPLKPQTIAFTALPDKTVLDADFAPGATATSGLMVTYTSSNSAVATIINNQVHITGAGTTVITAMQPGDNRNEPAQSVPQTLRVFKVPQSITFNALPQKHYGDEPFDPIAVASSGLPVTYASDNTAVAVIENGMIRVAGIGTANITASQPGDPTYEVAADVTQALTVLRQRLIITADDKTKQQGQLNPIFTCTISGFVNGDNIHGFSSPVTFSTDATEGSVPGEYSIQVSGAAAPAYDIEFVSGTLTVSAATVSESSLDAWFPSSSSLHVNIDVKAPQPAVLQLLDLSGRLLLSEKLTLTAGRNNYTLPAANLIPGAYLLKISGDGLQLTKKMLKR